MLKGFWKLTWVETKVFMREPMGVIAMFGFPLLFFFVFAWAFESEGVEPSAADQAPFNLAIFAALVIAVSATISLVAIISIYREGGILKRLRATPLSPVTILGAHVVVKLVVTLASLGLLVVAGRQVLPGTLDVDLVRFSAALLVGTLGVLSLGFVIASLVPTARFAQPITAALAYPMVAFSGLFFPLDSLGRPLEIAALCLPTTHAVTLMQSVWDGAGWDLTATVWLIAIVAVCLTVSTKVFRWE